MRIAVPLALPGLVRAPGARPSVLRSRPRSGCSAAMILFVGHSLSTMTGTAVAPFRSTGRGRSALGAAAGRVARAVARQPGVAEASPVATAPFAAMQHASALTGTIRSGAGSFLAVPPGYLARVAHLSIPPRLAPAWPGRARPAARRDVAGTAR